MKIAIFIIGIIASTVSMFVLNTTQPSDLAWISPDPQSQLLFLVLAAISSLMLFFAGVFAFAHLPRSVMLGLMLPAVFLGGSIAMIAAIIMIVAYLVDERRAHDTTASAR